MLRVHRLWKLSAAVLALPTLGGVLAHCGGDDSHPTPAAEAGAPDVTTGPDASGNETSTPHPDSGADAPPTEASTGGDSGDAGGPPGDAGDAATTGLSKINHFVVIYMENHSFDNLYGEFPNAEGRSSIEAGAPNVVQVAPEAGAYDTLPISASEITLTPAFADASLPNGPFSLETFVQPDQLTVDLHHLFYTEQFQINDGGMNQFVYFSDALGMSMGYWHTMHLPVPVVAQQFTVCDHFFHAAFGGSFLNHFWLISARTPEWMNAPAPDAGGPSIDNPTTIMDNPGIGEGQVTSDGYVVNTSFSVNTPHPPTISKTTLVPSQTFDTIGDRLNAANVDWAWYAGGWNDINAWLAADAAGSQPAGNFQYHHQPFVYFANYADGTALKTKHLKDEQDFLAAAKAGTLPGVSFVKPVGINNEHPGYTDVLQGDVHLLSLIEAVQNSPNWSDTAIIITYDEHGGQWDHVAPPSGDRWGPGSRVPAIIISPFAKKNYVDKTVYDTTSILKTIELRWGLQPLTSRDTAAHDLTPAFQF
jgi:phospholipase C